MSDYIGFLIEVGFENVIFIWGLFRCIGMKVYWVFMLVDLFGKFG